MTRSVWYILFVGLFLFVGCSSRKAFEPENRYDANAVGGHYEGTIVSVNRMGATLDNGRFIDKEGVSDIRLEKGFRFLNADKRYVLASDANGTLQIWDKKRQKVKKSVRLHSGVVSASVRYGKVAYVLNDNSFGVYDINNDKTVIENSTEPVYAIDARTAVPIFVDSLVVMPMLDGKLIIFDVNEPDMAKVVYISSAQSFNNVIFLDRTGDTLVSATPQKLFTIGDAGEFEKSADIVDLVLNGGYIYLFTRDGTVYKYDTALHEKAKRKYLFAQFSGVDVVGKSLYALDKQGSLIVTDKALKKEKIYDVGEVTSPIFMANGKLYKDGKIYDLTRLRYE